MVHQFHRHPPKGLYLIFELITTLFFRLTSWILGDVLGSCIHDRHRY